MTGPDFRVSGKAALNGCVSWLSKRPDAAGGYGPVPWLLLAIALFAAGSFYAASRPRGGASTSV
ncbi:MAG: hypothetical protein INF78_16735 [Roseomonas sp.]|nr:hypothetical protein [Roseomonas sp.]MCA3386378.1 hypothetical protein [Roseomonas sp.]MCA3397984.1 hypothetical protein [Roseomonas sp.]MCA3401755.1 hypothetical protein [Roseomonas sp.]MCA3405358.1 hypothetical protein [Roseomonas sp.]